VNMSSLDRLNEYKRPGSSKLRGGGRDQKVIDAWSQRATANSQIAPRAKGGDIKMPAQKAMQIRDSAAAPKISRKVERKMAGKDDPNFVGSTD